MGVYKASLGYLHWESRLLRKNQELIEVLILVVQLDKFLSSVMIQL